MQLPLIEPRPDLYDEAERWSLDELRARQLQRLQWSVRHAFDHVEHYRTAFEDRGVHPDDIRSLEDTRLLPFTSKADLRANYPFGMFAVPREQVSRVHASSGTTGRPTVVGSIVANPFFGRKSDRTSSRWGMRRPWMVIGLLAGSSGILVIAVAPTIAVVVVGWCIAQVFFNALLAAEVAVLPDQVPEAQRGMVAGVLGICTPVASVTGTFLVKVFTGNLLVMFLAPCVIGGFFVLLFALVLDDRRLAAADKPSWSLREFAGTFYVDPRKSPDFAWAFASRFLFVLAYAFLATYQAYYLLNKLGSTEE